MKPPPVIFPVGQEGWRVRRVWREHVFAVHSFIAPNGQSVTSREQFLAQCDQLQSDEQQAILEHFDPLTGRLCDDIKEEKQHEKKNAFDILKDANQKGNTPLSRSGSGGSIRKEESAKKGRRTLLHYFQSIGKSEARSGSPIKLGAASTPAKVRNEPLDQSLSHTFHGFRSSEVSLSQKYLDDGKTRISGEKSLTSPLNAESYGSPESDVFLSSGESPGTMGSPKAWAEDSSGESGITALDHDFDGSNETEIFTLDCTQSPGIDGGSHLTHPGKSVVETTDKVEVVRRRSQRVRSNRLSNEEETQDLGEKRKSKSSPITTGSSRSCRRNLVKSSELDTPPLKKATQPDLAASREKPPIPAKKRSWRKHEAEPQDRKLSLSMMKRRLSSKTTEESVLTPNLMARLTSCLTPKLEERLKSWGLRAGLEDPFPERLPAEERILRQQALRWLKPRLGMSYVQDWFSDPENQGVAPPESFSEIDLLLETTVSNVFKDLAQMEHMDLEQADQLRLELHDYFL